ncbi:hypothetical protein GGE65_007932 [Skermanella aerolata]|uniref:hypothetical protein n=1 Tax=Skermanella aerolata TaxID=393310 RepID=UPI003D22B845
MSAQDSIRVKHARGPCSEEVLTKLIEQHVVVRNGAGRNVSFTLGPEATLFSQPLQLRKDAPYDPSRIGDYRANVTRWLPETAEQRMRLAGSAVNHNLDASTYSRQIGEQSLIDLSWASSAMEGNTYDYLDTEALIKFGAEAEGHEIVEAAMTLSHKRALLLLENFSNPMMYDPRGVARLHALLMKGLISNEDLGRVRATDVGIRFSAYKPCGDRHQLALDQSSLLWQASRVENPFEASLLLLAGMDYIQSFDLAPPGQGHS